MISSEWREIVKKARFGCKQGFLEYDHKGKLRLTRMAETLLELGKTKYDIKMDTKEFIGGQNLKAVELGKDYKGVFVMGKTTTVEYDGDNKLVVEGELEGRPANLVLNQTNLRRIQEKHGFESDDWIGKKVTLTTEYTPYNGVDVLAIRIKK